MGIENGEKGGEMQKLEWERNDGWKERKRVRSLMGRYSGGSKATAMAGEEWKESGANNQWQHRK